MRSREKLVRTALRGNALFSLATGLALLLGAAPLAHVLGLPGPAPLWVVGVGLLPFAWSVWRAAGRTELRVPEIVGISLMDVGWVLGTVALALLWPGVFTVTGWWIAGAVAAVVALWATGQLTGLRHAHGIRA